MIVSEADGVQRSCHEKNDNCFWHLVFCCWCCCVNSCRFRCCSMSALCDSADMYVRQLNSNMHDRCWIKQMLVKLLRSQACLFMCAWKNNGPDLPTLLSQPSLGCYSASIFSRTTSVCSRNSGGSAGSLSAGATDLWPVLPFSKLTTLFFWILWSRKYIF